MELAAWLSWRFGEHVCVVCGEEPDATVAFPTDGLVQILLADPGSPWDVPVCVRHHRPNLWPTRTALEIADEHRAVMEHGPARVLELPLWD